MWYSEFSLQVGNDSNSLHCGCCGDGHLLHRPPRIRLPSNWSHQTELIFWGQVHYGRPSLCWICKWTFEKTLSVIYNLVNTSNYMWYSSCSHRAWHNYTEYIWDVFVICLCNIYYISTSIKLLSMSPTKYVCFIFKYIWDIFGLCVYVSTSSFICITDQICLFNI